MPPSRSTITPKLYERAFELISNDISNGELPVGLRLTEVALANRLGTSRAPIRRALILLAEQGLVQRVGANGYEVCAAKSHQLPITRNRLSAPEEMRSASRASWQVIYHDIEGAIVARTAFGSWHVNEVALARDYCVSRTIARDVLARLQQRGILTKDDKGRWFAPILSDQRVRDLFELRQILEPVALRNAALHVPRDTILRLRQNLTSVIGVEKAANYPSLLDHLEQDLHFTLLGYCQNAALLEAISLPQTMLVTQHFLFDWTNDMFVSEPFLPEHLAIYDHLLSGNIDEAAHALTQHLIESTERSIDRLHNIASRIHLPELNYLTRHLSDMR